MIHHGHITMFDRPVYSTHVSDFAELRTLVLPSEHSVILLVADADSVNSDVIHAVALRLIASGLIYVCCWGSDCERVHDLFDETEFGDGTSDREPVLMTTWHADDTLDEAIEFFLKVAFPLDHQVDTCSWLAVTVGDPGRADLVTQKIAKFIGESRNTNTEQDTEASG